MQSLSEGKAFAVIEASVTLACLFRETESLSLSLLDLYSPLCIISISGSIWDFNHGCLWFYSSSCWQDTVDVTHGVAKWISKLLVGDIFMVCVSNVYWAKHHWTCDRAVSCLINMFLITYSKRKNCEATHFIFIFETCYMYFYSSYKAET